MAIFKGNSNSGLEGGGDIWTRDAFRVAQFAALENQLMNYEIQEDYVNVVRVARMILRLQMEVMKYKPRPTKEEIALSYEDDSDTTLEDENKGTLYGKYTPTYEKLRNSLDQIEMFLTTSGRSSDPVQRSNASQSRIETVQRLRDILDDIFQLNTELGLNYQKFSGAFTAWQK